MNDKTNKYLKLMDLIYRDINLLDDKASDFFNLYENISTEIYGLNTKVKNKIEEIDKLDDSIKTNLTFDLNLVELILDRLENVEEQKNNCWAHLEGLYSTIRNLKKEIKKQLEVSLIDIEKLN